MEKSQSMEQHVIITTVGWLVEKKFCGTEDKILKYIEFLSLKFKTILYFVVFNKHYILNFRLLMSSIYLT